MIPSDADLSSEDKQAIKLRTGRYPVIFHPAAASMAASWQQQLQNSGKDLGKSTATPHISVREVGLEEEHLLAIKKRKASTTSEQYRERCNADEDMHAQANGFGMTQSRPKT